MTEDDVTRGVTQVNILNGKPFDPVSPPINIESVVATLPTGQEGRRAVETEPLLRTARRLVLRTRHCTQAVPEFCRRIRLGAAQPDRRP